MSLLHGTNLTEFLLQLLVFRFVSGFALTFFGLPSRLDRGPALTCYFGTLFIVWFVSKGFLAFKEARSSPDSVRLPDHPTLQRLQCGTADASPVRLAPLIALAILLMCG